MSPLMPLFTERIRIGGNIMITPATKVPAAGMAIAKVNLELPSIILLSPASF